MVGRNAEELFCFDELVSARALGEVTGNYDNVGLGLMDGFDARFDKSRVHATEVQVGEMHNRAHQAAFSSWEVWRGTMTRMASGLRRKVSGVFMRSSSPS
jgi:hypothetical protein